MLEFKLDIIVIYKQTPKRNYMNKLFTILFIIFSNSINAQVAESYISDALTDLNKVKVEINNTQIVLLDLEKKLNLAIDELNSSIARGYVDYYIVAENLQKYCSYSGIGYGLGYSFNEAIDDAKNAAKSACIKKFKSKNCNVSEQLQFKKTPPTNCRIIAEAYSI